MNIKSPKYLIVAAITFIILFLMNYVGSPAEDRLFRALLTAAAGVIGLTVGMWFVYKNKDGGSGPTFD